MLKTIKEFKVNYMHVMDETGKVDEKLMPSLNEKQIKEIYELMVKARFLDDKMLSLQRQGRIGTFAQIKGQEASNVASAYALEKNDWLVPSFRENGSLLTFGVPMSGIILGFGGDERGNFIPKNINALPPAVPVSTQTLHAAGIAFAMKLRKEKNAVLVYFGDGATSEGDFHEAMNFAGTFRLPVVFFNQNNQWAISVPRKTQTASETLAQKAIAYGFEGIQVDGNDVFAVYKATFEALKKAREGKGPTLIESYTYRMGDHTTADDAKKYRNEEELNEWRKKDPIDRLRKYMESKKIWNKKDEENIQKKVKDEIENAVKEFESIEKPNVSDMFSSMFEEMPDYLKEQLDYLEKVENES